MNSVYFQAHIEKKKIVMFVGLLRSIEDNLCFERIEDPRNNIFEFFVSSQSKKEFIEIMDLFFQKDLVIWYKEKDMSESSLYKNKN